MPAPVHESALPPILRLEEMGQLLGVSARSIRRAMLRPGWMFPPLPSDLAASPRWARDEVLALLSAARPGIAARRRFGA